jgi:predicted naringenin-chalcone synthase
LYWNYDPSLDAYLINKLKLRQDIVRLPVTEMGCAAGISGIIYAKNFTSQSGQGAPL